MNNKNPEHKILAILAIIFGGIGIVLSWVPIVNNIAFFFGIVALILGIVAFIRNRKGKKILTTIGTVLGVATIAIVLGTQAMYGKALDQLTNSNSTSKSSVEKAKQGSSYSGFTFKNNDFKTNHLTYKITAVKYFPSAGDQNKKTIVLEVDITNNTKKDINLLSDDNAYAYIHAYQKTSDTKEDLQPGTLALDDNANSPEQTREDVMDNDTVLPGKTVQGIIMFDTKENSNVFVTFENDDFKTIATKEYSIQ